MKVIALQSFSDAVHGSHAAGQVFDLPPGVDWLRVGLVEVVAEPEAEPEAPEAEPVKRARKKKV